MGYDIRTNLSCSNTAIISSGSTFYQKWAKNLIKIENGVFEYYSRGYFLHDDIIHVSKQYPQELFTGITWNDTDIYDRIKYTLIFKDGECEQINSEPGYVYGIYYDKYYEMPSDLFERFRKHLGHYIERIDIVREDSNNGTHFDFLNDKPDEDGFISYYTITWENAEHKFTATKRFTSQIAIDYEKKESKPSKMLQEYKEQIETGHDDSYTDLPF